MTGEGTTAATRTVDDHAHHITVAAATRATPTPQAAIIALRNVKRDFRGVTLGEMIVNGIATVVATDGIVGTDDGVTMIASAAAVTLIVGGEETIVRIATKSHSSVAPALEAKAPPRSENPLLISAMSRRFWNASGA
jgi:hypothetical protein